MRMQPTRPRTLTVQISTRAASDAVLDSRELNPCPVDDDKPHTMNLLFHLLQLAAAMERREQWDWYQRNNRASCACWSPTSGDFRTR